MQAFDYVVTLKRPNYNMFNWVNHLLLLLSVAVFSYTAYTYTDVRLFYSIILVLTITYWLYCILRSKQTGESIFYRLGLIIASIGWFHNIYGNAWVGGLLLVIAFLEKQVKFPNEIGFSTVSITLNTFPKKKYNWNEIVNAVLKDGLITIDYKNNKLLQKEVEQNISPELEKEFNKFCRDRLETRKSQSLTSSD